MYLHEFGFQTAELAKIASQMQFTCTNMNVGQGKDGQPSISFLTLYPIGPVTAWSLKEETQATTVMVNEPQMGSPPRGSVTLAQMAVTGLSAVFFFGLAWLQSAGIAGAIGAATATGFVAFCSNDILFIVRGRIGKVVMRLLDLAGQILLVSIVVALLLLMGLLFLFQLALTFHLVVFS
jgi:hypothetical protein